MVKKAIEAAETLIVFPPKGCTFNHALLVFSAFILIGFVGGLSIGLYLTQ